MGNKKYQEAIKSYKKALEIFDEQSDEYKSNEKNKKLKGKIEEKIDYLEVQQRMSRINVGNRYSNAGSSGYSNAGRWKNQTQERSITSNNQERRNGNQSRLNSTNELDWRQ